MNHLDHFLRDLGVPLEMAGWWMFASHCLPVLRFCELETKRYYSSFFEKAETGTFEDFSTGGGGGPTGKIRGRKSSLDFGFHTHFLFLADLSPCPPPNTWSLSMMDNSGCKRTGWGSGESGMSSSGFLRTDYKISWDHHKPSAEVLSSSQASQLPEFQWRTDDSKST